MTRDDAIEAIVLATSTNETKSKGRVRKVTFEIPADGSNPFEGMGGERIHIVVVRLNNDETPAAPVENPKQNAAPDRKRWEDMPLSQQAAIRCGEPEFQKFLDRSICAVRGWSGPKDAEEAAHVVRHFCQIDSRSELNRNEQAATLWKRLDSDFWAWQRGYQQ